MLNQAQARRQQEEEDKLEEGDCLSGACPRAVSDETTADSPLEQDEHAELTSNGEDTLPFDFDPELFAPARLGVRKSRRAKW